MQIFETTESLQEYLSTFKKKNTSIGFVPTMGALHQGHLSLVNEAQNTCDLVVVSVFVNPTQFNNKEDLAKYPKPLQQDIRLLESVNCDVLFSPSSDEIYGDNLQAEQFDFDELDLVMEGEFREGHFNGVGTVVKRLFEIVQPNNAFFGEKDFQQLQIIKKMVEKNKLPVKIKGCEILREKNGLAMSSRNARLNEEQRKEASFIYKTLQKAQQLFKEESAEKVISWVQQEFQNNNLLELEYFSIADEKTLQSNRLKEKGKVYRAFIAVFAGDIRLIDNISL
jgi:pantoate--beta-alanine ligase